MKIISLALLLSMSLTAHADNAGSPIPPALELPAYSRHYSANRDPFVDAADAIQRASSSGRYVFIEVGGSWCSWCQKFDQILHHNPALARAFYDQFVVLKVSVDDANDNAKFIAGLPAFSGYPHFFVADGDDIFLSQDPTGLVVDGDFSIDRITQLIAAMQRHSANKSASTPTQNNNNHDLPSKAQHDDK